MMAGLNSEAVQIRPCRCVDVPAVLALWALARSEHAITPDRSEDVERLLAEGGGALLVAESAGDIVGALIAAWDGWRGNMYRLAVRPDRRREGMALTLIRAGEEHLRGRGARRITALVAHDDVVANAVWSAAGYAQDRQIGRRVRNV
jgi:ribosomal protein S18 acetylase RimI-like enzyme